MGDTAWKLVKSATFAGIVGLAVLHADAFSRIGSYALGAFRGAVTLTGKAPSATPATKGGPNG